MTFPLHVAAANNNVDCLGALHEASASDLECVDIVGRTPLLVAAESASVNASAFLLRAGSSLAHRDEGNRCFNDLALSSGGAVFVALFEVAGLAKPITHIRGSIIAYPDLDPDRGVVLFPWEGTGIVVGPSNADHQIVPASRKPCIVSIELHNKGTMPIMFQCNYEAIHGSYVFEPNNGQVPPNSTKMIRVAMQLRESKSLDLLVH